MVPEEIYDLYKVQDKTLLKVDEQISYIAVDGDTVYTKNNNISFFILNPSFFSFEIMLIM